MNKIKYGIVGTGQTVGIANNHLEGINSCDDTDLVAIYDVDRHMAEAFCEKNNLRNVVICDTYEELLDLVDAVSICIPNDQHVDAAIKALHKDKHILIEKPISVNASSVDRLIEVADTKKDKVAMVSFNYREFPIYQYIKELLEDGKLGKIYSCRQQLGGNRIANKDVKLEWRMDEEQSGPGAVSDFGCHMLDIAHYLFSDSEGSMQDFSLLTNTVITERDDIKTGEKRKVTNDDVAMFVARTESGALLSFSASRVGTCNHSIEVVGEGGMVYGDFSKPNQVTVWLKDKESGYQDKDKKTIDVVGKSGHVGIIQDFAKCIHGGSENKRTVRHGKYIQKIIDQML